MRKLYYILFFCFFATQQHAQIKLDTISFTLYCLENQFQVEDNLLDQIDSIYAKHGFNDIEYNTDIYQAIVFGFTDSKGSKKSNQILSEKRAEFVFNEIVKFSPPHSSTIMGFGESNPFASNETETGRAKNRRVEVTIIYRQTKILKLPPKQKTIYSDTVLVFDDGTKLKLNLHDYHLIKNCLKYERKTSLYDLYEDLAVNDDNENYYSFGKVTLKWCNENCLANKITLSIPVPDTLIKAYQKEIKAFVKQLKKQQVKLTKHKNNMWYIDAVTYCPFQWPGCGFCCRGKGKDKQRIRRVKYVAKDGYKIISASYSHGIMFKYKKLKRPKKKIKFKTYCPHLLPTVSIIAVNKANLDTLFYASGTETAINYKRRCFNCVDRDTVIHKFMGIKIHKRLLRRKYIFKPKDYQHKLPRKTQHDAN